MTARDRTILIVVCVVAAIGGAWMFVVSPKRDQAAKLGTQLSSAQNALNTARSQVVTNEAARRSFPANYTTIARLGEAVPADDDVPSLIYQLQGAANRSHVQFISLELSPSSASSTSPSGSSPSTSGTSSSSIPPGVAVGAGGFDVESFTFTFQGNFFRIADFMNRIQRFVVANNKQVSVSGRLMTLGSLNLSAGDQGFPQVQASIAATTYLVPKSQGLVAGATATGPSGTTSASPQSVSTPTSTTSSSTASATPTPAAAATPPSP
jgi:hypothetical protein